VLKKKATVFSLDIRKIALQYRHRVFHRFEQAKFGYGGSILGSSQFTLLPQLTLKMMLNLKVVKNDLEIIFSLH